VLHASPTIADVSSTGRPAVLSGGEQWVHVYDSAGNVTANGETIAYTNPMTAAPTVAVVGGKTWIVSASTHFGSPEWGTVFAWKTGTSLGAAPWPTFKNNAARTGTTPMVLTPHGAVGDRWIALGGRSSFLGNPTSAEFSVPGGRAQHSSVATSTGRRPPGPRRCTA